MKISEWDKKRIVRIIHLTVYNSKIIVIQQWIGNNVWNVYNCDIIDFIFKKSNYNFFKFVVYNCEFIDIMKNYSQLLFVTNNYRQIGVSIIVNS